MNKSPRWFSWAAAILLTGGLLASASWLLGVTLVADPLAETGRLPWELPLQPVAVEPDRYEDSLERLQAATAEEKDVLRRKRERFAELPAEEKNELRDFHQALMEHPRRDELEFILERYDEWLRTLAPAKRAEIQDLPLEERIAKIKQFREEEAWRALGFFGETKLPDKDIPRLYDWIDEFVSQREDDILKRLSERHAEHIRGSRSDDSRRRRLAYALTDFSLDELEDFVSVADVESLLKGLSEEAREILTSRESNEVRVVLVQRWIRFALIARNIPKVSDEELTRFFQEDLSEEQREKLDRMPPEQRRQRLEWYYHSRNSRFRGRRGF